MLGSTSNPILLNSVYIDSEYRVATLSETFALPLYLVIKNWGWDDKRGVAKEEIVSFFESLEEARIYIANQYSEKHK